MKKIFFENFLALLHKIKYFFRNISIYLSNNILKKKHVKGRSSFISKDKFHKYTKNAFIFLFISFIIFFIIPISLLFYHAKNLKTFAQNAKVSISSNDFVSLQKDFTNISNEYNKLRIATFLLGWVQIFPQGKGLYECFGALDEVFPLVDDLFLEIQSDTNIIGIDKNVVPIRQRPTDDKIQSSIIAFQKILNKRENIKKALHSIRMHIDNIDEKAYPESLFDFKIQKNIKQVKSLTDEIDNLFSISIPFLNSASWFFGMEGDKTYIILFQNEYERRATGGFLTSFSTLTLSNGSINISQSQNIYEIDQTIPNTDLPEFLSRYHIGVEQFHLRDSNISPDLPKSIEMFDSLYQKSSKHIKYDGIITIDAHVLSDIINIFGEIDIDGVSFNSNKYKSIETDEIYPNIEAIYKIFQNVGREGATYQDDRKSLLGKLMLSIIEKITQFSPNDERLPLFFQKIRENIERKHILFYMKNPNIQKDLEKYGYAGEMNKDWKDDYLNVNMVNLAGAKSNLFIDEKIESKTTIKNNKISREVVLSFSNPYKHSNCSQNQIEVLCLNAVLRNVIRVYVPLGSKLVSFKKTSGEKGLNDIKTYNEMNRTVFEGFITVTPKGKKEKVTIDYVLPSSFNNKPYRLFLQKQSGIDEEKQEISFSVNGKMIYKNNYETDMIYELEKNIYYMPVTY